MSRINAPPHSIILVLFNTRIFLKKVPKNSIVYLIFSQMSHPLILLYSEFP